MDHLVNKDIEPGVINNEMLSTAINDQGPKGEAGRLAREEGRAINTILALRLEFLNILRIDHLWMLSAITKLSLSNNIIEKIENLDQLVNLKELDLSFNKIEVIENLDELVHLELLTLYSNSISRIENIDTLTKLHIFSIGKNNIADKENIFYLRQFRKLKSINMADNPCAAEDNFRIFVVTFLPQIDYYEYKRAFASEREQGAEIYSDTLKMVIDSERALLEKEEQDERDRIEAELHAESFVEFLGDTQLFDSMFLTDTDGKNFLTMKDEIEKKFNEYQENFNNTTRRIFDVGQHQYRIRKIEVEQFFNCIVTAKTNNQLTSQAVMERFLEEKQTIFKSIRGMQDTFEFDPDQQMSDYSVRMQNINDSFNDALHATWKTLMGLEMTLFDQLEETNLQFERNLTEMVNHFIEEAQGLFTICRNLEMEYLTQVTEAANKLFNLYGMQEAGVHFPEELRDILEDKDILNNALGTSHDIHMQLIDSREDRLVSQANKWLEHLVSHLAKDEIVRNRIKVLEINHFLDIQREEFDELQTLPIGPLLDPDISAALG